MGLVEKDEEAVDKAGLIVIVCGHDVLPWGACEPVRLDVEEGEVFWEEKEGVDLPRREDEEEERDDPAADLER